jgi:CHRD domain-containing protein
MKQYEKIFSALTVLGLASCGGGTSIGGLDAEASFRFALTQAAEVPVPKPTTASGIAQIIIYPERIDYELTGTSIIGITMAHIHSGAAGVAGPIVVTLYNQAASGTINGVFATGSLTAANLPSGVTLASLKTLLLSGNAYVNVHTTANPTGEIRGQVK